MPTFDGKLVSDAWGIVLPAARADGVHFLLTSGRRTMRHQAQLRAAYERFLRGGPWAPLAARPNPRAPHIDEGQESHAIDVNARDGGAGRLFRWLRSKGVRAAFTVPGEPWHIEVPEADLLRLARELERENDLRFSPPTERRWARELDRLRREHRDAPRRRVLVRELTALRKRIWRAAQPKSKGGDGKGWTESRKVRYKALMDRTR